MVPYRSMSGCCMQKVKTASDLCPGHLLSDHYWLWRILLAGPNCLTCQDLGRIEQGRGLSLSRVQFC